MLAASDSQHNNIMSVIIFSIQTLDCDFSPLLYFRTVKKFWYFPETLYLTTVTETEDIMNAVAIMILKSCVLHLINPLTHEYVTYNSTPCIVFYQCTDKALCFHLIKRTAVSFIQSVPVCVRGSWTVKWEMTQREVFIRQFLSPLWCSTLTYKQF